MLTANIAKLLTRLHYFHQRDNLIHVFTCSYETSQHQNLEVLKHVTTKTTHHLPTKHSLQRVVEKLSCRKL